MQQLIKIIEIGDKMKEKIKNIEFGGVMNKKTQYKALSPLVSGWGATYAAQHLKACIYERLNGDSRHFILCHTYDFYKNTPIKSAKN